MFEDVSTNPFGNDTMFSTYLDFLWCSLDVERQRVTESLVVK